MAVQRAPRMRAVVRSRARFSRYSVERRWGRCVHTSDNNFIGESQGRRRPFPSLVPLLSGRRLRIPAPTLPISLTALHKGRSPSLSRPLPCSPISRPLTKEVAAGLGGGGRQRDTTGQFLSHGGGLPSGALCPSAITGTSGRPAARAPEWKAAHGSLGKTPHCHRSNLWPATL